MPQVTMLSRIVMPTGRGWPIGPLRPIPADPPGTGGGAYGGGADGPGGGGSDGGMGGGASVMRTPSGGDEDRARLTADPPSGVDLTTAFERATEGHFVGVLEVATDRQTTRDTRDAHTERLQQTRQVHRRRFALDVRVRSENHFFDALVADARQQLLHAQLIGSDTVDR